MERSEILKSIGFSDKFLRALSEFEKTVPNIYYENPIRENVSEINLPDTSGQITIDQSSDNYNQNIIIRQS